MHMIRKGMIWCLLMLLALTAAAAELWEPVVSDPMPVVSIETQDGSRFLTEPSRDTKLAGTIEYVDAVITVYEDGKAVIDGEEAQVKARGNYTLNYPKKSIRIKFDKKQSMAGLHDGEKYKSWVLLAEWKDLSQTHSPVALYLAHALLGADGYYVTDCRNVEVYLNGRYWGVYLLAEQQEVKPGRTGLPEVPEDYTGNDIGYFLEYDAYFSEEAALSGGDPTFEVYHEGVTGEQYGYTIKSDINADSQKRFIAGYVRRAYQIVRRAVHDGTHYAFNEAGTAISAFEGVSAEETIGRILDIQSLVDMYILMEITCNPDVGWSSFYITIDRTAEGDGRLVFQAPWDFDSAFGIRADYEQRTGFFVPGKGNPWFEAVAGEGWFQARVRQRWAELKADGVPERALALIGEHREAYADSYTRNYARWPERIRDGNGELIDEVNACRSQEEASAYLQRWLSDRFLWLDSQWGIQ